MVQLFAHRRKIQLPHAAMISSLLLCFICFFVLGPEARAATQGSPAHIGPKSHYLALGDSLSYGFQPDFDLHHGYVDYLWSDLKAKGVDTLVNMGCAGETSESMIDGGCPTSLIRKYPYTGSQLDAAVDYLKRHKGEVSPVTLDIGANDLLGHIDSKTCEVDIEEFHTSLTELDNNLKNTILPRLRDAMLINGKMSGDLAVMNYYDPFQNACPETVKLVQEFDQHIARDVQNFAILVDVFNTFGGAKTPNTQLCSYTWMCSYFHDLHAKDVGYRAIATAFEQALKY